MRVFGLCENISQERREQVFIQSDSASLIQFETQVYKEILAATKRDRRQEKIDFLMKFGPGFRQYGQDFIK